MHFTARSLFMAAGLLMVALLILSGTGAADLAAQQNDAAPIRLQADTFIPAAGEQPDIPPGLTISGYARGTNGYYIVQFNGPVQEDWKAQLAGVGGELLDYIPDFAYKTRMNPAQAARAAGLDSVAWVGLFQPAFKISPRQIASDVGATRPTTLNPTWTVDRSTLLWSRIAMSMVPGDESARWSSPSTSGKA